MPSVKTIIRLLSIVGPAAVAWQSPSTAAALVEQLPLGDGVALCVAVSAASFAFQFTKIVTPAKSHIPLQPVGDSRIIHKILGHVAEVFGEGDRHSVGTGIWNWFGPSYNKLLRIRFFNQDMYLTAHPKDMSYMFVDNMPGYPKGKISAMAKRILGDGLATQLDDDIALVHRKELSQAFSPASLTLIANRVVPWHARRLMQDIDAELDKTTKTTSATSTASVELALRPILKDAASKIVADAAFRTESEEESKWFVKTFEEAWDQWNNFARISKLIDNALIRSNLIVAQKLGLIQKRVSRMQQQILSEDEKRAEKKAQGLLSDDDDGVADRKALVDHLVMSDKIDPSTVMDHCVTFLFAGYDTTAQAMLFVIYHLARYPSVQEKLFEELFPVIGAKAVSRVEDLRGCKYLVACINETLRLFPPTFGLAREVLEDDVLPGTKQFVPKGANVFVAFIQMHRAKDIWGEDADQFRPERFEEEGFDEKCGWAFAPFSTGRRNCVGKDFAMNLMLMVVAVLARNYKLTWPKDAKDPFLINSPLLGTREPVKVIFTPRGE